MAAGLSRIALHPVFTGGSEQLKENEKEEEDMGEVYIHGMQRAAGLHLLYKKYPKTQCL